MTGKNTIILRMAAALLLKDGKLSIRDIQSLPLVDNEQLARAVALSLYNRFDLELEDEVLRLRTKNLHPKKILKAESKLTKEDFRRTLDKYALSDVFQSVGER